MKKILTDLKAYVFFLDRGVFLTTSLLTTAGILVNYGLNMNAGISKLPSQLQLISWYGIFLAAFSLPYLCCFIFQKKNYFSHRNFLWILFLGPILFAWKMYYNPHFHFSPYFAENVFWNRVVYFPFKLFVIAAGLFLFWFAFDRNQPFYGCSAKDFNPKPYFIMLVIMLPLIAAASTQPDFLAMYPKLKSIRIFTSQHPEAWYKLLYELSYGIDFVSIELYFRGFLVLAFVKYAGKDAILPMASFYCTIHYGKPVGECISSFFGGLLLGVVTYHSRTIYGGLMVHLGIAWLMELGGYLGSRL